MEIIYYVTIYHFAKAVDGEYTIECEKTLGKRKKRELEKTLSSIFGNNTVKVLDIEYEREKSMVNPSALSAILIDEEEEAE